MENISIEASETLFEIATVFPKNNEKYSIVLAINPDVNRLGDPYFKMYDGKLFSKAEHVTRIKFKSPEIVKEHAGIIKSKTKLNNQEIKELILYLNDLNRTFRKYTNWDVLKYLWNTERGFNVGDIDDYTSGVFDDEFKNNPSYLESVLKMPDYTLL